MLRLFSTQRIAFLIIFAVLGTVTVIHDPDFYFHLVAGQYILTHQSLPHVDVFSFTMAGAPWHMHEWLFEVLVAGMFSLDGERVVVWFIAATGVGAIYLVFRAGLGWREKGLFWLLPALVVMVFYLPYVTQRPQVITYFLISVFLAALFSLKYHGRTQALIGLPILMLIWVNSHGGYLLGIAIVGLFTASEWIVWWLAGKEEKKKRQLKQLTGVLLLTIMASLVNPYFIEHWWFPFKLMNMRSMSVISEWQAPDFNDPYFLGYLACIVLFLGQYLSLKKTPDLTEWLLPGGMILASMSAARHLPLALLVMLPFFLRTLDRPSRMSRLFSRDQKRSQGNDLGPRENVFNAVLLLIVGVLLFVLSPGLKVGQQHLKQLILPVGAVDYVEKNRITGRMFNQYRYGGYLLYRRYPEQRVFIDIRADMYGDRMMSDYSAIFFAAKGWKSIFDRYRFDAVLCEHDAPLVKPLLETGEFRLAYQDKYNVVLLRRDGGKP